jgi:5-methylcytosine-specific restriction endonuclease McrA
VLRPCSICGVLSRGPRCARHPLNRPTTTERGLGSTWQKVAREQVEREPWCSCPGCSLHQGPCNETQDLTADHTTPRAVGGSHVDGVATLCRRCNSARDASGGLHARAGKADDPATHRLCHAGREPGHRHWWSVRPHSSRSRHLSPSSDELFSVPLARPHLRPALQELPPSDPFHRLHAVRTVTDWVRVDHPPATALLSE